MIGSLRGRLTGKQPPQVMLECGGIGYEIETPMSTFLDLPDLGAEVFLHTHLQVREDSQTLYGFASNQEKALFRLLIKVSGVGAKMALGILSGMSVSDFQRCVQFEDTALLVRIPGVGKKTAERLIIEMRDRVNVGHVSALPKGEVRRSDARSEAIDALVALGYKPAEVARLVSTLDTDKQSAEDIIRLALKRVAS